MADNGWLDRALQGGSDDSEDDSSYVSSSASESEISDFEEKQPSSVKNAVKTEAQRARVSRIFQEMKEENSAQSLPNQSHVSDMYEVFNSRFARPPKDTSVAGVLRRIDQEHAISKTSEGEDLSRFRVRATQPSLKRPVSEILEAVEHEFIEIEEDGIFAGQVVKLKRKVSVHSEEAKRYLKRQKRKPGEQSVSALDSYLDQMKVKTVNTMGKTAADWSQFKDAKGLARDLEVERKRGYLVDKAFLAKVSDQQ